MTIAPLLAFPFFSGCNNDGGDQSPDPKKAEAPLPPPPVARTASENTQPPSVSQERALITWTPTLAQEMTRHDSANWEMASWSNGSVFATNWQPDNVVFRDGVMLLVLDDKGCPGQCDSQPTASGEYRTKRETFGYGYYEARMKPAKGDGLMSGSLFTYRGVYSKPSHDEIDIEFLGKDCSLQLNFYAAGQGGHERVFSPGDLGFNPCDNFHNYGFEWRPEAITFYVDGRAIHSVSSSEAALPSRPGKLMVNFWPGTPKVNGWLGQFNYPGHPAQAEYDWIRYSSLSDVAGKPAVAGTEQPKPIAPDNSARPVKAIAPMAPLPISEITQGSFAFNGGDVSSPAIGVYSFSAQAARDPGFGIITGNHDLAKRQTLKFEIKGTLSKTAQGNYARFIIQVYSNTDSDSSPSVSLDPVTLGKGYSTIAVDLAGDIKKVKKIQFLLVSDNGNIQVEIKNLRFE